MKQPEIHFIGNNLFDYKNVNSSSLKDCVNYVKSKTIIGLDIETSRKYKKGLYPDSNKDVYKAGLDPYLSKVVMIQIGDLDNVFVIDVRQFNKTYLQPLIDVLNWNEGLLIVGHNLKFEGKHLRHNYGLRLKKVWDTMLCEINLTNGLQLGYGLADLAGRYLNIQKTEDITLFDNKHSYQDDNDYAIEQVDIQYIDKSTRLGFLNIEDKPFTEEQVRYGADDITYPLLIKDLQLKSKYNPIVCHKLENSFSQVLADIELKGMYFDSNKWVSVADSHIPLYNYYLNKLDNYVIENVPEFTGSRDLFNNKETCTVQWTSSTQVVKLFKHLGFCPKEKSKQTKRLEYTVGDKALFKLLNKENKERYYKKEKVEITDNQSLILNYLSFKKEEQAVTTFGKPWLKYVHPITKRVHSNYKQIMNTGRISSSSPNLQNIPSTKEYRSCFTAPKNYKIVNADYAAQEIRVLAEVSGVNEMQDFFLKGNEIYGDDFHAWVADKSFKIIYDNQDYHVPPKDLKDGTKNPLFKHTKERDTSKNISFKVSYGGSAYTMKDEFGVSEEEAQKFIDGWFAPFKGLRENFEQTKKNAVKNGYVLIDSFTNRKWFFKHFEEMKSIQKEVWELYPVDWKEMSKEDKQEWKDENKHITSPMWKKYFTLASSLERKGLNFRIQGLSGGMTKLACILLRNWLVENNIENAYLNNVIHDETNSECFDDIDLLNTYSKKVEECMEEAGKYFCKTVPMSAKAHIGDFWAH
jgi:DNA polymerase I-like protein with 3'-5' exonuclease and polymerase domains